MLHVTPEIGQIIMGGGNSIQIAKKAVEQGMVSLRRSGLLKVKAGITSLEEINRVTQDL
jgi:type IV pilus assembly protein PilB